MDIGDAVKADAERFRSFVDGDILPRDVTFDADKFLALAEFAHGVFSLEKTYRHGGGITVQWNDVHELLAKLADAYNEHYKYTYGINPPKTPSPQP